jgi:hypothetical protein
VPQLHEEKNLTNNMNDAIWQQRANLASATVPESATNLALPSAAANHAVTMRPAAPWIALNDAAAGIPSIAPSPSIIDMTHSPPHSTPVVAIASRLENALLVNLGQRSRYLQRAKAKQALHDYYVKCRREGKVRPTNPNYTFESRHIHAVKRPRNERNGRFMKKDPERLDESVEIGKGVTASLQRPL